MYTTNLKEGGHTAHGHDLGQTMYDCGRLLAAVGRFGAVFFLGPKAPQQEEPGNTNRGRVCTDAWCDEE